MVIEQVSKPAHETVLDHIEQALASELWEERLSVVELAQGLFLDLPTEHTVERLVRVLARLSRDAKWEVRRAVVPVLVEARRPGANNIIEQLAGDDNQWVRQAAERARRKLARITTPAEKTDRRARFAFETIRGLTGKSSEEIYEAAVLVGEKYYEELAGDTAHELNTYRAAMEGLLKELELHLGRRRSDPQVDEIFQRIHERSRYLKTLVRGLLEYARDADLAFERQPLRPLISEALNVAREKAGAYLGDQKVEEVLTIPPGIELEVSRGRLVQALVNILSNAFESLAGRGEGMKVQVAVAPPADDRVTLTITDTGCGMDLAQVEHATKRFRSLKKSQGGVGLGLPLAVKIIEREHQGSFRIESAPGVGTTVILELPVAREEP